MTLQSNVYIYIWIGKKCDVTVSSIKTFCSHITCVHLVCIWQDGTIIIHTVRCGQYIRTLTPQCDAHSILSIPAIVVSDMGQIILYSSEISCLDNTVCFSLAYSYFMVGIICNGYNVYSHVITIFYFFCNTIFYFFCNTIFSAHVCMCAILI